MKSLSKSNLNIDMLKGKRSSAVVTHSGRLSDQNLDQFTTTHTDRTDCRLNGGFCVNGNMDHVVIERLNLEIKMVGIDVDQRHF